MSSHFLATGSSEMGRLIRERREWDASLGPPDQWPCELQALVRLMLDTRTPMFIAWGPRLVMLYNDAYLAILGDKHPAALGEPVAKSWPEAWDVIEPLLQRTLAGEPQYFENMGVTVRRHGVDEQAWFTFSYSPISVPGNEGAGLFCCVAETTSQVLANRELTREKEQRRQDEADLRFMARASEALAAVSDYRQTLASIAQLAVPHFADWVAVDMLVDEDTLERLAVAHVDPANVRLAEDLYRRFQPDPDTRTGSWRAIRTREPLFIPQITPAMLELLVPNEDYRDALAALGFHSYMCVPILSRHRVLGAISFLTSDSGRVYTERDLSNVMGLAARAAVAIENAELVQALRDADMAKDVFLATLAHELRNPLAPIMNAIAILRMPHAAADMRERMLDLTERQVKHLVRLVDDLLEISRITRGKIELRRERIDVRDVVRASVEASAADAAKAHHHVEVRLPDTPLPVDADLARLKQVVDNLLANAHKYTPEGGTVSVEAHADGAEAVLTVRDTGAGIPREVLGKVFDIFMQVERNKGGLGIGLALVKQLVTLHGGTVTAHSAGPGHGAAFVIRLPLLEAAERDIGESAPGEPAAGPSRRVLVIDDNVDAADTLAMLIATAGHRVETAYDGPSGLDAARSLAPDCVFLDVGMPGMDGHEVARELRRMPQAAAARIVAVTGWGQKQDRELTREAGFDAHLVKPVDFQAVMQVLNGG